MRKPDHPPNLLLAQSQWFDWPIWRRFCRVVVVFALSWILVQSAELDPAAGRKHSWQRIEYNLVPSPQLGIGEFWLTVDAGGYDKRPVLRLSISFPSRVDTPLPKPIADPTSFTVRLHLVDGRVALPSDSHLGRRSYSLVGSSLGATFSVSYEFPWMGHVMEESSIELGVSGQTYWIGLPPGFLMDPAEVLSSDGNGGGKLTSRVAPAREKNEADVNWKRVCYELGRIQNGWHLSLYVSNSGETNAEVVLYRERARWSADDPKVELQIKTSQGELVLGRHAETRVHEDGMRRSDGFQVSVPLELGRGWGVLRIKVDSKVYEQVVPLGLFGGSHGVGKVGNGPRSDQPNPRR